ncbi:hypothetical protein HanIR_Chr14g0684951 [Helianthus annuus]|nr:hypothetical protein HanIR_Chr14g0684951 [Helianthus annuus]
MCCEWRYLFNHHYQPSLPLDTHTHIYIHTYMGRYLKEKDHIRSFVFLVLLEIRRYHKHIKDT